MLELCNALHELDARLVKTFGDIDKLLTSCVGSLLILDPTVDTCYLWSYFMHFGRETGE